VNNSTHLNHTERIGASKHSKFINTSNTVMSHASGMALTPVGVMSKSVIGGAQMSTGSGENSSTMIEREKRALEKIRARQKKEVEQMMEYELQMERIRKINEEKALKQREKE
jgi:hypothetical protein